MKIAAVFLPAAIDPAKGIDAVFSFVETLTQVDDHGSATPFLLTALPVRKDSTHWVLDLKPSVTFQDGHPMTAATVAAAMNREVKLSDSAKTDLPGAVFTATGPLQVTVDTVTPQPLLPYDLADRAFAVYDEPVVAAAGNGPYVLAGKGVFTAPYALASVDARGMKLVAYDTYWQGKPALAGITITLVADGQARAAAVESGQVDLADGANTPDILQLIKGRSDVKLKLSDVPLLRINMYLNPSTAPLNNVAVRRAVLMAVNYNALGSQFTGGIGEPASGIFPSSYPLTVATQKADIAAAKQALDAAGWTVGSSSTRAKNGHRLTLTLLIYNERPEMKPVSIGIQSMLKQIGIDVKITSQPYDPKMYDDASKWNLALYNDYSISPTGAPDAYLSQLFDAKSSLNYWHIANPKLDAQLNALPTANDRKAALAAAQRAIWNDAYMATVSFQRDGALVSKNWRSYVPGSGYQQQEWTWQTAPSS